MKKVELRMDENQKYEIIKKLVDSNGNKKTAALKIGCTLRTVNRLIQGHNSKGKAFFIHGNRGKKPLHTLSEDTRTTISGLYNSKYSDANFTHFTEILAEHENLFISRSTVENILSVQDVLSPKAHRSTKKTLKKSWNSKRIKPLRRLKSLQYRIRF